MTPMRPSPPKRLPLPMAALTVAFLLPLLGGCGDNTPLIEITPRKHDFGRVLQGELPEVEFHITNHSDQTVGFKAQPNCSCFAAAQTLRPLDPGQSQTFRVMFDSTAKPPGPVKSKWITIHTDLPHTDPILVPLEGEIYRAYNLTPTSFNLGRIDGRPANYEPRTIRVRPSSGYRVIEVKAVANPPIFAVKTSPRGSGGFDVVISIPRDLTRPVGLLRGHVRLDLHLESPDHTTLRQSTKVEFQGFWSKAAPKGD